VKIPGIGEVKPAYAAAGGAMVLGIVGYAYYKNRKQSAAAASAAAASTTASATDQSGIGAGSSGIDPNTGLPYANAAYGAYGTYGGIDPATGIPYYDEITQSSTTGSSNAITTNAAWVQQAESDAQNLFGATSVLATSAVGKYLSQTTSGLQSNEYLLMQQVVAELGQPPTGGPYRLIQAAGTSTTAGGSSYASLTPGQVVKIPVAVTPPKTITSIARQFNETTAEILANNPGVSLTSTNVQVNVPVLIKKGDTVQSLATKFGESVEHIEQVLAGQGII
jgi:hypothetical protein